MIRYLGISGKRGSGKTTLAVGLERILPALYPGWTASLQGFADFLKEGLILHFGASREAVYGDDAAKEIPFPTNPRLTHRQAMQQHGQHFRDLDPDFWVRKWKENADVYARYSKGNVLAIAHDMRHRNEADFLRAHGGYLVRLAYPGANPGDTHKSETELDDYAGFDLTLPRMTPNETIAHVLTQLEGRGFFS